MNLLRLSVSKTTLKIEKTELTVEKCVNYDRVAFTFDESWADLVRTATFWRGSKAADVYQILLDDTNECDIPWELLQKDGYIQIGVTGIGADGSLVTTQPIAQSVARGTYRDARIPTDPTPTIYEQINQQLKSCTTRVDTLYEEAQTGRFKGDKGDKGDPGKPFTYADFTPEQLAALKGEKGDKGDPGEKGAQGDKGEPGSKGDKGDTGDKGSPGEKGDKGDPFTYNDFTAAQLAGLKGEKGEKGDKGDPGEKGSPGAAATISIGTVTTGDPGTDASVTNSGTEHAAIFDFVIPKGESGASGDFMEKTNPTCTGSFSQNRKPGTAVGDRSHAAGFWPTASGAFSHAVGNQTQAIGDSSHAEGMNSIARGRVSDGGTKNLQRTMRTSRLRHEWRTPGKLKGDDAGHLFGDAFGGSKEIDNVVSQFRHLNRSGYAKMEKQWMRALEKGKTIAVRFQLEYEGDSLRPSKFNVCYAIDGLIEKIQFENR